MNGNATSGSSSAGLLAFAVVGWTLCLAAFVYGYFLYGPSQYQKGLAVGLNPNIMSVDSGALASGDTALNRNLLTINGKIRSVDASQMTLETNTIIGGENLRLAQIHFGENTLVFERSVRRITDPETGEQGGIVQENAIEISRLQPGDTVEVQTDISDTAYLRAQRIVLQ
jgi:hypothetical protein